MTRTAQLDKSLLLRRTVPANSAPSSRVAVDAAVRPQSLEVFVNGQRLDRARFAYDHSVRLLTLPEALLPGDTLLVRASAA